MTTTSGKNRSILSGLIDAPSPVVEVSKPEPAPRTPDRLGSRLSSLSRVASGDVKEKTLHLIDPSRCRMWSRHNRRYDLLNERTCADLLEGLRSQGEQEFPAIVRPLLDSSEFDFEVICGARRHWSVRFLNQIEHRPIKFLIEVRDLDDEAAFRLSDVENRARDDISDYERALDYRAAVEEYYGGVARRMAERLEVGEVWLSRFLELAKLPPVIVQAFGDLRQLREHHARIIKPLLANEDSKSAIISAAETIVADQSIRSTAKEPLIEAAKVVERLKSAARPTPPSKTPSPRLVASESGASLLSVRTQGRKRATIEVLLDANATNDEFQKAFAALMAEFRPTR